MAQAGVRVSERRAARAACRLLKPRAGADGVATLYAAPPAVPVRRPMAVADKRSSFVIQLLRQRGLICRATLRVAVAVAVAVGALAVLAPA